MAKSGKAPNIPGDPAMIRGAFEQYTRLMLEEETKRGGDVTVLPMPDASGSYLGSWRVLVAEPPEVAKRVQFFYDIALETIEECCETGEWGKIVDGFRFKLKLERIWINPYPGSVPHDVC